MLAACGCSFNREPRYGVEWHIGHYVAHLREFPDSDATTVANLFLAVAQSVQFGCCSTWPKPCSYHEGWFDGFGAAVDA